MTEKTPGKPAKSVRREAVTDNTSQAFTNEERAAMKERVSERKAQRPRGSRAANADGEADVLAKIAQMQEKDRIIGERLHTVIKASAPDLSAKLWYGMPAYTKDGKIVCFFQCAQKFKTRYETLGFSDQAKLDNGACWPTAFAVTEWSAEVESTISTLVKNAVS